MLFDLRGRGRRRTVQGIYLGLALLLGAGLVGFGIGGGSGSGGIVNALTGNSGSNGVSFTAAISKDRKAVAAHPQSAADWGTLVSDLFHQSSTGDNYNTTSGEFTTAARGVLAQLSQAWQQYLVVNPNNPDPSLAQDMVEIYGPSNNALNESTNAYRAEQIVISKKSAPTSADYQTLAIFAYQAKNVREADLAAAQSIDLAPASQRAQLRAEFKALKANPNALAQAESEANSSANGPQTFSIPSTTGTATATATTGTIKAATTKAKG